MNCQNSADIETTAVAFRTAVTSPTQRNLPQKVAEASANLGQLILQPAAAQLVNKRLLIVPDGVLHYTPFPALTLPQTRRTKYQCSLNCPT